MRSFVLLPVALCCAALGSSGQAAEVTGHRQGDSTTYQVTGFDRVALGTAASVEVRVGPAWSVRAVGPADAVAAMRVEREGTSLRLRARDGWRPDREALDRRVRVFVTLPKLLAASTSGSGHLLVDRVTGTTLRGAVSGSGSLAIGSVALDEFDVAIAGSGTLTASGTAGRLRVRNSGSGEMRAPRLRASGATVAVAGSGSVRADVRGPARVSLAGSGLVDLGPNAQCAVKRAGSGRVVCSG